MRTVEYRLYVNGQAATRADLDKVETVIVEQAVDMAWEAQLEILQRTDDRGVWSGPSETLGRSFSRVRVEVKNGDSWIALIDGPVVGYDDNMSSEPGRSALTLRVQDDSVYLNRKERYCLFEGKLDHEVAQALFATASQIARSVVDNTPAPPAGAPLAVTQRGTEMDLLRIIARRQGMHAYVLPGSEPGQSIGYLKRPPTEASGQPRLVLLGSSRNVDRFEVSQRSLRNARYTGAQLNIDDKTIVTRQSSWRDVSLLGSRDTVDDADSLATGLVPPGDAQQMDLDQAVSALQDRSSYSLRAAGSVRAGCYSGVLQPYQVVTVTGANQRLCTNYAVSRVVHRLGRSLYEQEFTLGGNATAETGTASGPSEAIF